MEKTRKRGHCGSWYHYRWFRVLLVIVGIDMFLLGVSFALGYNFLDFFAGISGAVVRAIIGIAYVLVSGYIIKHALGYKKEQEKQNLICHHCVAEASEE